MTSRTPFPTSLISILPFLVLVLATVCTRDEPETSLALSRAEVEIIVTETLDETAPPSWPEPGISDAQLMMEAIRAAKADISPPQPGISRAEVETLIESAVSETAETSKPLDRSDVEEIFRALVSETVEPTESPAPSAVETDAPDTVACIPPNSSPAHYTRYVVENANGRYDTRVTA